MSRRPQQDDERVLVSRYPLQDDGLPLPGADLEQFRREDRQNVKNKQLKEQVWPTSMTYSAATPSRQKT